MNICNKKRGEAEGICNSHDSESYYRDVQECDRCAGLRWGLLKQVRKCPMALTPLACSVTVPAIHVVSTVLFAWLDNF